MKIQAVELIPLKVARDPRGSLTELFPSRDDPRMKIAQWNCVRSHANVLRGMHAHSRYDELYLPVSGRIFFLLKDARASSPTFACEQSFSAGQITDLAVLVPRGVAHGVYFETPGALLYGLSASWTGADEYEFRWNDASVETIWPTNNPDLSERDAKAGSFSEMLRAMTSAREPVPG